MRPNFPNFMKSTHRFILTLALGLLATLLPSTSSGQAAKKKLNVLFIAVDDLRPELGCYGADEIKTPNIDRLAQRGMVFERAYCQQAICMASRASLLSGYRPDKGRIYNCGPLFDAVPDALTLNQFFKNHGYETVGMGKIYHHHSDVKTGWSKDYYFPEGDWVGRGYVAKASKDIVRQYTRQHPKAHRKGLGPAY